MFYSKYASSTGRLLVAVWYIAILSASFIVPQAVSAANDIAYSGSNVTGLVEEVITLPGLSVTSDDLTVPVNLSVDSGILSMTTTTGLTFDGATTGSNISFSGSVADVNAALATLQYRTINTGTVTLNASLSLPGEVYFPGNGHIYEVIDNGGGISWDDAKIAAEALTKNGADGYLATVTTQAENDYLLGKLTGDGWFGASDAATENDWKWVTGPETGTSFWTGLDDGAPVGGLFSNWASGEPNNSGDEDCAQFYSSGSGWNDLPCNGPYLDYYVVEYGAPGDLPVAPPSASFTITTSEPTPQTLPIASCLDLIDVYNNGTDNRYDNLQLTADVDCTGEDIEPMFAQEDPDFGHLGFRGEFDGQDFEMTNVTIANVFDDGVGLFAYSNDAVFRDITINSTVAGDECVGGLVGQATNTLFDNVSTAGTVTSNYRAGGVVGCYYGTAGEYSVTDSTSTSDIAGQERLGGLIGNIDMDGSAEFIVSTNNASGEVSPTGWGNGGLVGAAELDDSSSLNINDNISEGINAPDGYTVGGIVGYLYTDNSSTATLEANTVSGDVLGDETVGGLVGEAYSESSEENAITIRNSSITINVSSDDGDDTGGLIGHAEEIYITRSFVTGNVTGADDETGGLIGDSYSSTIEESYTTGTIDGDDSLVGGLTGRNSETTIRRSYATGTVTGDDRVGGLVGANGGYIFDSYSRASVTADSEVGGLAGRCGRDITNSYSTGQVTGSSDVGGLLGYSDGCDVVDSFWDTQTTLQASSAEGTGKTTAEMKSRATFTDTATTGLDTPWDFSTVWKITTAVNDGYPCLIWQSVSCDQTDDDDDGITTAVEDSAPNGGDANNDGTADSEQPNVSSFVNTVTGEYIALAVDDSCTVQAVSTDAESANSIHDPGFEYPAGLLDFTVDCGTPGFTTTVQQYFFGVDNSGLILRKFNTSNNSYITLAMATITQDTIDGKNVTVASYEITDGGDLDDDGVANGVIIDPAGVALSVVGAPNTGLGGSWL